MHFYLEHEGGPQNETRVTSSYDGQTFNFYITISYVISTNTVFTCRLEDNNYYSNANIHVPFSEPFNTWITDEMQDGSVTHYYKYMITNQAPTIDGLTGPISYNKNSPYTFTAAASDPESDSITYKWVIDGITQSTTNSSISYMSSGSNPAHTIAIKATDALGLTSAWTNKTFTIPTASNEKPTVSAVTGPRSGTLGTYTWTATGSDNEEGTLTYEWYIDGAYKSGSNSFTHQFSSNDTLGQHTIRVRVKDNNGEYSDYATLTFSLNMSEQVAPPTFTPSGGTYYSTQNVTINCDITNAVIRYTLDGSEPTASSPEYSNEIFLNSSTVIKAKAFTLGMTESETISAMYTIKPLTAFTELENWSYYVTIALVIIVIVVLDVTGLILWFKPGKESVSEENLPIHRTTKYFRLIMTLIHKILLLS
ncbi:MAG TPA: chitobiase/beta-hexosaminidase C-terminal domain-containing protein [Candidatus Sulfotelmatobacter sp.]|nr:chitobiase/beta-hexosaminidase C-terminal domain-containing protein [Candidatus Sulfotelmatobacter sp.]